MEKLQKLIKENKALQKWHHDRHNHIEAAACAIKDAAYREALEAIKEDQRLNVDVWYCR